MTPEQINQRIAEACGWRHMTDYANLRQGWVDPKGALSELPDYHNDATACISAARSLLTNDVLMGRYIGWLMHYTGGYIGVAPTNRQALLVIDAPADVRAKSLVRALDLWEGV